MRFCQSLNPDTLIRLKIIIKVNFLVRTITAVIFAAIMLFSIQKGGWLFTGLFGLITILAANEFTTLANKCKGASVKRILSILTALSFYLCIVLMFSLALPQALYCWALAFAFVIAVLVAELYSKDSSHIANIAYTLFPVLYIAVPMALLYVLGNMPGNGGQSGYSPALPLMLFLCIWSNDVGAYCTGCTIGRHKLFERVSPKKTWEGSIGGAVFTLAAAGLVSHSIPAMYSIYPLPVWLGMGLVVVLFGTWGDLVESLMKREMGIKDSGKILPGHGGILDRFDSAFLAIPAVTVYFVCLLYLK